MANNLILEERKTLHLSGVTDVDCFNDNEIRLYTELGTLTVKGKDLHINEISVESGNALVEGEVCSLVYGDKVSRKLGIKGRLLK
ncbi:MAG: YabP/YqfC family sporulation protein [Ruminococcus sp.]|nr:YabP/YqfC family sporulation protein [Ruminococcus sp.]